MNACTSPSSSCLSPPRGPDLPVREAAETTSLRPPVIIAGVQAHLGFGITAQRDPAGVGVASLAIGLEALGYDELWANDGRLGSGLATLAEAATSTERIDLCLGVAPLSERTAAAIAAEVELLRLPHARLVLGVGTGSGRSLAVARDAVAELRRLLPEVRLCIAALGPGMCALGGEVADVVLLNWVFPDRIAWSRERIALGAAAARPMPRVAGYVRVAIGADAPARLAAEGERYRTRPRLYERQFDAQDTAQRGFPGVAAVDPAHVPELLAPYREALDSCVVRALTAEPGVAAWLETAAAANLRA
jgi:alkanesulfonate monooxygenase SsuD/methylene tetrahydromethanopterin reductase-like flavin-dependent oxidoreductase (luciferase family)